MLMLVSLNPSADIAQAEQTGQAQVLTLRVGQISKEVWLRSG